MKSSELHCPYLNSPVKAEHCSCSALPSTVHCISDLVNLSLTSLPWPALRSDSLPYPAFPSTTLPYPPYFCPQSQSQTYLATPGPELQPAARQPEARAAGQRVFVQLQGTHGARRESCSTRLPSDATLQAAAAVAAAARAPRRNWPDGQCSCSPNCMCPACSRQWRARSAAARQDCRTLQGQL